MMSYFTVLTKEELHQPLPSEVVDYMQYPTDDGQQYTLWDLTLSKRELIDGRWLINCSLPNKIYLHNRCAISGLTEEEYDMWVQRVGVENIHEDDTVFEFEVQTST